MEKIALLHLSDIHFKSAEDRVISRVKSIAATFNGHPPVEATIVVVTGDIANAGLAVEYAVARSFFNELRTALKNIPSAGRIEFVLIPGNHDNDYTKADAVRQMIVQQVLATPAQPRAEEVIAACTAIQTNFFEFMSEFEERPAISKNRVFFSRVFTVCGKTVRFNCYNSAWHETREAQKGTLSFPIASAVGSDDPSDVTVALIHHPSRWFAIENYRQVETHLEKSADVVLTGHEHRPGQFLRATTPSEGVQYYEAGALQPHEPHGTASSEFSVIFLDLVKRRHHHIAYEWKDGLYSRKESSSWRPYLRNEHLRAGFHFSDKFLEFLDDAGAQFTHPSRSHLYLQDIYVPPQLKELRPLTNRIVEIVGARDVLEVARAEGRLVIYGPTWSGKTALCKWMVRNFHANDLVTIYVRGEDLTSSDPTFVMSVIERAFLSQYVSNIDTFRQLPAAARALVIDDYQDLSVPKAARPELLAQLEKYFGCVVLIADELMRIDEISYGDGEVNPLLSYRRFDLQPFGHVLRSKLAKKWHDLSLGDVPEETVHLRIVQTENVLRAVVATSTVPPLPIFLLIFLQSEEAMRKNDASSVEHSGSFGFLHQELIKKSLVAVAGPADWDTTHKYLGELAYGMFERGERTVSEEDLSKHHRVYCAQFDLDIDRGEMVRYLVSCGVLQQEHGSYSFKYPYLLPFFVAYAVKDSPGRFDAHIQRLVATVHKTEHAHIVMFLSYFLRDERVVDHVLLKARELYADTPPCDMELHVEFLNDLKGDDIELELPQSTPEENRNALRCELDRRESQRLEVPEARLDREHATEDLNEVLRINVAMKTIEILGQVLRNFPGSTLGDRKIEIARECYELSLRTLERMFELLRSNVTKIVEDFTRHLEDQRGIPYDDAHQKAKYGVYGLAEMLAFGLIWKTGDAVGLQKLARTFESLVQGSPSIGVCLIDLAVHLDHLNSFPEAKVDALAKRTKDVLLARAVLKRLVHRHFFLSSKHEQLRQRVCAKLEIKVPTAVAKRRAD